MASVRGMKKRTPMQRFLTDPLSAFILFAFLFIFKVLPLDTASKLGSKVGLLLPKILKKKQKVVLHNLHKVFPTMPLEEQQSIARKVWQNWGRVVAELPHLDEIVDTRLHIEGEERLKVISRQKEHGGFLFSAHISNFEIYARLAKRYHIPMAEIYRSANNPWVEKFVFQKRADLMIPKGSAGARQMIKALKENYWIALLCDQKMNDGIEVQFLNHPSMATPNVAKMVLKMNIPAYPVSAKRLEGDKVAFRVVVEPPLLVEKEDTVQTLTQKMNDCMSAWVFDNPTEWLWLHRRWDKKEYIEGENK